MSREFSLYLDALRLFAALLVLVSHSIGYAFGAPAWWPNSVGHNAVIIFFLLSGYVIAYVADHKENNFRAFWISRFARIYSVAVPALVITIACDQIGLALNADFYKGGLTTHDHVAVRLGASLLFVNELWLVSIMPFSNSPYWSLCYEMAYYLLFSIWCFGGRHRAWWLALALLVIGPKILLLAPIWIAGVWLYRHRPWYDVRTATAWVLWLGSLAGMAAFQAADVGTQLSRWTGDQIGGWLYLRLHFSKHFLGDYLLAVLIGMNFVGFRALAPHFAPFFDRAGSAIRGAAGYTFSVYLFHLPIVFVLCILTAGMGHTGLRWTVVLLGTLAVTVAAGRLTEQRKDALRRWIATHAWPERGTSKLPLVRPPEAPHA